MGFLDRIPEFHTVAEFRRAARLRSAEARRAADPQTDDLLIATDLAGYAAEMTIKAAYFRVVGKGPDDPITLGEILDGAKRRYKALLGLKWPGNSHNVVAWAELLIAERQARGIPFSIGLSDRLTGQAKAIAGNWKEDLRYHRNRPRPTEADQVFRAVRWLFESESRLFR